VSYRPLPDNEALLDLLVGRVTEGLTGAETEQLDRAIEGDAGIDPDCLEPAAAAASVAFARADRRAARMPQALRARILERAVSGPAEVVFLKDRREHEAPTAPAARRPWLSGAAVGWYAAAALAVVLVLPRPQSSVPPAPTLNEQRAALLASAPDAITVPWLPSEQAGYEQVTGDVVWSDSAQQGFLRLVGLPANEPTLAQYQLWIIDPDRDEQPVDGGVFDVAAGGQVLVPIDAKLAVEVPGAFALTLEQPGGVVVSDGPLLVVAVSGPQTG
jgi:anti-sigma-K factor RskA